jgi:hypothetical protein
MLSGRSGRESNQVLQSIVSVLTAVMILAGPAAVVPQAAVVAAENNTVTVTVYSDYV